MAHALNPDKHPLPWRQYCSSSHPTFYSLQDPSRHPSWTSTVTARHSATVELPSSGDVDLFATSSSLVLSELNASHPAWPYPSDTPPRLNAVDNLPAVGVFVGVFTMDSAVERRHMIRQSYMSHWRSRRPGTEAVVVKFVMGMPTKRLEKAVQLEAEGQFASICGERCLPSSAIAYEDARALLTHKQPSTI